MSEPQAKSISFAKVVVVFAVAFGTGLGLCGLDFLLAAKGIGRGHQEFGVGPLDGVSLIVMLLSAFGLVITMIAWFATAAILSIIRKDTEPQQLFDNKDDQDRSS